MKKESSRERVNYKAELQPENALELRFLSDPEFLEGLAWGVPRYGHPEGEIWKHIKDVLANIDRLDLDPEQRRKLRIIAFVHDTFKYKEDKSYPRDWTKHHSVFARKFLERYTDEKDLLEVTELHDEAYHCWCKRFLYKQPERSQQRLQALLQRLSDALQLYYLFFKCDTQTGDKNQAPVRWFERQVDGLQAVEL